jgi:hypothetical protein
MNRGNKGKCHTEESKSIVCLGLRDVAPCWDCEVESTARAKTRQAVLQGNNVVATWPGIQGQSRLEATEQGLFDFALSMVYPPVQLLPNESRRGGLSYFFAIFVREPLLKRPQTVGPSQRYTHPDPTYIRQQWLKNATYRAPLEERQHSRALLQLSYTCRNVQAIERKFAVQQVLRDINTDSWSGAYKLLDLCMPKMYKATCDGLYQQRWALF